MKKSQFGSLLLTVRYAYGAHGNGSGSVLQICVPVVVVSYGAEAVRPVNKKNERADLSIAEDNRAAFFARKIFETLLLDQPEHSRGTHFGTPGCSESEPP